MSSWIKLSRGLLDWEWYGDANVCRVFVHLLLKANYKPSRYQGHDIPAGSLVAGVHSIAEQTGLTASQVRTVFKKISGTEITIKTTNKFSIITITNWERYQTDDKQIANKSQTDNKRIATSKEGKKERISSNEDNIRPSDVSESVWNDFKKIRKDKKAAITQTAIDGIRKEAEGVGWSMQRALEECCSRGWAGFKGKWIEEQNGKPERKSRAQDLADQAGRLMAELGQGESGAGGDGVFQ